MRKSLLVLGAIIAAVLTVFLLRHYLNPASEQCAVTCLSDSQCGGEAIGERYCQGASVVAMTQHSACVNGGTCQSTCTTGYEVKVLADCDTTCTDGVCG